MSPPRLCKNWSVVWHRLASVLTAALVVSLPVPGRGAGEAGGDLPKGTAAACSLAHEERHLATRAADGETIRLSDGRDVRLGGVLAPHAPAGVAAESWIPSAQAQAFLTNLVSGRNIELAFASARTDRHGRLLAQAFVEDAGSWRWVQGELLAHGHARASALPGEGACLAAMLSLEAAAREARRGLWSNAAYEVRKAERTGDLMRERSEFVVVEGRIESAAEHGRRLYLNFGADWHTDFTVTVPPRLVRAAPEAARALLALEGRLVRVRGWIERRNGPSIEIADVGEVEALEGARMPTKAP